jgi:aldehyde:ferredoxin oxidoreductase
MNKIVRINMDELKVSEEESSKDLMLLGGRGLSAKILSTEIDPRVHPLSGANKLIIAPGLFTGTTIPSTGRLSIGTKSPLTCGIKESNVGGVVGQKIARLGIKAIIIEGKPKNRNLYLIKVDNKKVQIEPADNLKGLRNYELTEKLFAQYGTHVGILSIGPAGEMFLPSATVAVTDRRGKPSRHAGRGGTGAVLGSKGIKAIVVDDANGVMPEISDEPALKNIIKEFTARLVKIGSGVHNYTTAILVKPINEVGGLPTRNFSEGRFEGADKISGEALTTLIKERGGKLGDACCPGCAIQCSNIFKDKNENEITSALEYETVALLGSNLAIDDLDEIAKMDRLCDEIGIDTIETGATLGVAMESGFIPFGDSKSAINLIEEIGRGTLAGRLLGSGCVTVGKAFGCCRVPAVKGQAIPGYDPRALKGMGVTYATSPMGADHTAGVAQPGVGKVDTLKPEGQVELSRNLQTWTAVLDNTGLCLYAAPSSGTMKFAVQFVNALYGLSMEVEDLLNIGREILEMEFAFNKAAGIGEETNDVPFYMRKEVLPQTGTVFDVLKEEMKSICN